MSTESIFHDDDATDLPFEEWDTPVESEAGDEIEAIDGTETNNGEKTSRSAETPVSAGDSLEISGGVASESEIGIGETQISNLDAVPFENWTHPSEADENADNGLSQILRYVDRFPTTTRTYLSAFQSGVTMRLSELFRDGSGQLAKLVQTTNAGDSINWLEFDTLHHIAAGTGERVTNRLSATRNQTPQVSRRSVLKFGSLAAGSAVVASILTTEEDSVRQGSGTEGVPAFGYGGQPLTEERTAAGAAAETEPTDTRTTATDRIPSTTITSNRTAGDPPTATATETGSESPPATTATPVPRTDRPTTEPSGTESPPTRTMASASEPVPAGGGSSGGGSSGGGSSGGNVGNSGGSSGGRSTTDVDSGSTPTPTETTPRRTSETARTTGATAGLGQQSYGEQGYGGVVVE